MSKAAISRLHPVPTNADEWIARLRASDVTAEDRLAFQAWLDEDRTHPIEFERSSSIGRMAAAIKAMPEMAGTLGHRLEALHAGAGAPARQSPPRRRLFWATAATCAIVAVAGGWWVQRDASSERLQTAHGARKSTALADGSVIELNTDTEARVDLTGPERRVVLVKGEAYFDVAKDPSRPFVVTAGNAEVRVLGTQFSVRERDGAVEVVVARGRVKVSEIGVLTANADPLEVTPGTRLVLNGAVQKVSAVDAQRATAWRAGIIEFDGLTLEQVVAEINRYSDRPITFADDRLRGQRMSGRVRTGDVAAFRFMLKEQFGIASVDRSGRITLSR